MTLYKVSDIKKLFGCGSKKAYQIMHMKNFPSFKINGTLYVEEDELKRWICRCKGKDLVI